MTLWLFEDAMVHAKTMTVDGRWSTVGTANIDRMSMTGNFEVNLEFYDDALAEHMERVFTTDLSNATRSEEHTSEPSHVAISYAVFCLKKKRKTQTTRPRSDTYREGA